MSYNVLVSIPYLFLFFLQSLKDWMLIVAVLVLVAVDVVILFIYTLVANFERGITAQLILHREKPRDIDGVSDDKLVNAKSSINSIFISLQPQGIVTEFYAYVCISTYQDILQGVLYSYKMFLQVVALFLAFSIRKVKIKGLNDSKYVAATIYVTSLVLAVIVVSTFTLGRFINTLTVLFCTGYFVGTTVILSFLFIPLVSFSYNKQHNIDIDVIIGIIS